MPAIMQLPGPLVASPDSDFLPDSGVLVFEHFAWSTNSVEHQRAYYLTAVVAPEEDGVGYYGHIAALPGCGGSGETVEEVLSELRDAFTSLYDAYGGNPPFSRPEPPPENAQVCQICMSLRVEKAAAGQA